MATLTYTGTLSSFHHGAGGLVICIPLAELETDHTPDESMKRGRIGQVVTVTVETADAPEDDAS